MRATSVAAKRAIKTGTIVHQPVVNSLPLPAEAIGVARWLDGLAVGVLALTAAVAAATFRDYGLGWDDYTHSQYGTLLVSLYRSGFADPRALSFVNLYMYGGGFDILAALAAKVLPFDLFETRRLMGAAVGLIGLFATWRLGSPSRRTVRRIDRAHPARRLPALLRRYVHQRKGRAVRDNKRDRAPRHRAGIRGISARDAGNGRAVRRRHRTGDRLARHGRLRSPRRVSTAAAHHCD